MTVPLFSQIYTTELIWNTADSLRQVALATREDIEARGKAMGGNVGVRLTEFSTEEKEFVVAMTVACSGLPCYTISIFRKDLDAYMLIRESSARAENLQVSVDTQREELLFVSWSDLLVRVPFSELLK